MRRAHFPYLLPYLTVLALAGSCLPACGKKHKGLDPVGGTGSAPDSGAVNFPLQGVWSTNCYPWDNQDVSQREELRFEGNSVTQISELYYESKKCQGTMGLVEYRGTYSLGAASSAVTGATEIDLSVSQALITLTYSSAVETMNESRGCGFSDWQVGHSRDVSQTECLHQGGIGRTPFNIIQVDGHYLRLGILESDSGDTIGRTPRTRLQKLSETTYVRRL